jgi:hypothetical protein
MIVIACYLVLSRVPFIHNFSSVTPLFSDHTSDTGVSENNRVTLSKSWTKGTLDRNKTTHNSSFSGYPKYARQFGNHAPHKLMWDALFPNGWRICLLGNVNPIEFYDIMQLRIKQIFIVNFRRRERHTLHST